MANVQLGSKAIGSIVTIRKDNKPYEFIIIHQGRPSDFYDVSCDGTWLLTKDVYTTRERWYNSIDGSLSNNYKRSNVHRILNASGGNNLLTGLESSIRTQIKQVKIPYRSGEGTDKTGVKNKLCKWKYRIRLAV